jgi:hypothetical protein
VDAADAGAGGMLIPTARFVKHQDLGSATEYALSLLGLMDPRLLRPFAYHNVEAIIHHQYHNVKLPDLSDVQLLLQQREMNRQ